MLSDWFAGNDSSPSIFIRILSGLTTGALCVTVAQPTDVVKIRMQAQGAIGHHSYTKVFQAYSEIARKEGIRGLWKGNGYISLAIFLSDLHLY